jgi:hypothetical protein
MTDTRVHLQDESGPSAAVCPPDAVLCHDCNSASSVVRHVPRSLALLPDVANTCGRAAASPGVVAGSPPRTGSPMTVRSPNQTIQMLSRFGEAARGG